MDLNVLYNYANKLMIEDGVGFYQALSQAIEDFLPDEREEVKDDLLTELDNYFTNKATV